MAGKNGVSAELLSSFADSIFSGPFHWLPPADALDDWQTGAWDERFPSIRQTLNKVMHPL